MSLEPESRWASFEKLSRATAKLRYKIQQIKTLKPTEKGHVEERLIDAGKRSSEMVTLKVTGCNDTVMRG